MLLSLARILFMKVTETPNHLLRAGCDETVVSELQALAKRYKRTCSLTLQELEACGSIDDATEKKNSKDSEGFIKQLLFHLKGLFATRRLALSTCLIWLSWACIGMGYPLFYLYLP